MNPRQIILKLISIGDVKHEHPHSNTHPHSHPKTLHTTISFTIMIIALGQQRGCNLCDGRLLAFGSWTLGLIHHHPLSPCAWMCFLWYCVSWSLCQVTPAHPPTPHTQTPTRFGPHHHIIAELHRVHLSLFASLVCVVFRCNLPPALWCFTPSSAPTYRHYYTHRGHALHHSPLIAAATAATEGLPARAPPPFPFMCITFHAPHFLCTLHTCTHSQITSDTYTPSIPTRH